MKILVTGGAGFIGSVLVPKLLKEGHDVTVLDNFLYKQNTLLEHCKSPKFHIVRGDVRNKKILKEQVSRADVIIPLAAIVGMPACKHNPELAEQVNFEHPRDVVLFKTKDQIVLFPNTNSGYGIGTPMEVCTEESELKPISVYGVTKVKAEKAILEGENSAVFRLATVFGVSPKMRLDLLVNDFTYRAWWDKFITLFEKDFVRNYVYIGDVADLFVWGIANFEKVKGEIFNFGLSNANLTKLQLAETIKRHVPEFTIMVAEVGKDPDQRNYIVSNEKIEKRGFKATTSIDAGVEELLKSFQILNPSNYSNLL